MHERLGNSVLVVAFDGLDKELIEKFECKTLLGMEEFGRIDNDTGISKRCTSELFASLHTGELHQQHGVTGLKTWKNQQKGRIVDTLAPKRFEDQVTGFSRLRKTLKTLLEADECFYDKNDLEVESVFEKIDNSRALNFPGYNPSPFTLTDAVEMSRRDTENRGAEQIIDEWEFARRQQQLFRTVNTYYDFLMAHFHRPDAHQHIYGDPEIQDRYDESRLEELYLEMDDFAAEIIDRFENHFHKIIFLSDHGLPQGSQHNKNAFYSSNKELFGDSVPHLTDFHDLILDTCTKIGEAKGQEAVIQ